MSLCAYVCTNSFLSSVFKFIWIHCEVFFIGWLVGFHHLNKILMLFYVDSLVSTFTKETWKLNDHCYMIGIEFISFFKEDTFFDEDNKIFKIRELTRLPPLSLTETLRFGFMLWESRERVVEGPRGQGQVEPFLKPVSPQNTEMVPGAGSSSIDLQFVSADLLPPDTALNTSFSSHGGYVPRWRKGKGEAILKSAFITFFWIFWLTFCVRKV